MSEKHQRWSVFGFALFWVFVFASTFFRQGFLRRPGIESALTSRPRPRPRLLVLHHAPTQVDTTPPPPLPAVPKPSLAHPFTSHKHRLPLVRRSTPQTGTRPPLQLLAAQQGVRVVPGACRCLSCWRGGAKTFGSEQRGSRGVGVRTGACGWVGGCAERVLAGDSAWGGWESECNGRAGWVESSAAGQGCGGQGTGARGKGLRIILQSETAAIETPFD